MAAKGTGGNGKVKDETGQGKTKKKDVLKYDREVKNFRAETLQRIYLFKAARQEWFATADNETDLQPTSDTVYYSLKMDKKRVSIIKKMGFNLDKIQPHRRTLRPRGFFTMKRNTSELDFEEMMKGKDRDEAPIIKEFRKKAKKARKKLVKRQKKLEKQELKKRKKKAYADGDKVFDELVDADTQKGTDALKATADREGLGDEAKKGIKELDTGIDERKGEGDDMEKKEILITPSSEAFDNIMSDLKHVYDFGASGVTDEDVKEMKRIWKETENISEKKTKRKTKPVKEKRNNVEWLKTFGKKCLNKGKLLRRIRDGEPIDWPPGFKPCNCQIAEGDKLIVLKSVCNCSELCNKKGEDVQNNPNSENFAKLPINGVVGPRDNLPATSASGTIVGKIVDSLEIIRKKVTPKSSQASRISASTNEEVKDGTPAPNITTLNGNELKQTNDTSKSKPEEDKLENEENKKSNVQETEGGSIQEKNSSIIYIKNFKSKKSAKAPLYTDVLSEQKEPESMKEEDLVSQENSVKDVENMKPKNSLSSSSGRNKIPADVAARLSEDARDKSQDPKPILGKGKRKKGLSEQGHVSFDVGEGQSPLAGANTNGGSVENKKKKKNKMQTVMSVMSIIKRRD